MGSATGKPFGQVAQRGHSWRGSAKEEEPLEGRVSLDRRGAGSRERIAPVYVHLPGRAPRLVVGHLGEDAGNEHEGDGPARDVDGGVGAVLVRVVLVGVPVGAVAAVGGQRAAGGGGVGPLGALVVAAQALVELLGALVAAEAVEAGAAAVAEARQAVVALELLVPLPAHVVVPPARFVGRGRAPAAAPAAGGRPAAARPLAAPGLRRGGGRPRARQRLVEELLARFGGPPRRRRPLGPVALGAGGAGRLRGQQ